MDAKEQFNNQAKFYSSSKTFSAGESLNILSNILKSSDKLSSMGEDKILFFSNSGLFINILSVD